MLAKRPQEQVEQTIANKQVEFLESELMQTKDDLEHKLNRQRIYYEQQLDKLLEKIGDLTANRQFSNCNS